MKIVLSEYKVHNLLLNWLKIDLNTTPSYAKPMQSAYLSPG